ncbi:MAG: 4Fe-4S dicluster domain-containing protein [Rhodocyclaceae bacterium]|jgi:ferredoxin|nr:4Fe-4S dicluster domain-containing protein [Rhodocyclaceae bacterium]
MTIAYPEFHASCCTRYRYRYSECRRCADACPHEAIVLDDHGAEIDRSRCQNCALCVSACHTGALASATFKPIDLLRQAIKQPAYSIACAPSGLAADATVPCLGAIDAVMIAYLGKRRIPLSLLGSAHCSDCPHGARGAAQLVLNLDAASALKRAAQEEGRDWLDPGLVDTSVVSKPVRAERRQLFRRFIGRGVDAVTASQTAARAVIPDRAIRAGPYVGTEQRELLQIVCERKDGQPARIGWHEALPLMQLTLQAGCTACEACFRACPTGAIQIAEDSADWALTFQTDRCVACEVCLEVCQPRVLDAAAGFDARPEQPVQVLHRLHKQRCARCDRFFVSARPAETCPVCRDDEEAFAAIFG